MQTVTIEDVKRYIDMQINPQPEQFSDSNRWKAQIIQQKSNLYILLEILCTIEGMITIEQITVLSLVENILDDFITEIPLEETFYQLQNIPLRFIQDVSVVNKISQLLVKITRNLYAKTCKLDKPVFLLTPKNEVPNIIMEKAYQDIITDLQTNDDVGRCFYINILPLFFEFAYNFKEQKVDMAISIFYNVFHSFNFFNEHREIYGAMLDKVLHSDFINFLYDIFNANTKSSFSSFSCLIEILDMDSIPNEIYYLMVDLLSKLMTNDELLLQQNYCQGIAQFLHTVFNKKCMVDDSFLFFVLDVLTRWSNKNINVFNTLSIHLFNYNNYYQSKFEDGEKFQISHECIIEKFKDENVKYKILDKLETIMNNYILHIMSMIDQFTMDMYQMVNDERRHVRYIIKYLIYLQTHPNEKKDNVFRFAVHQIKSLFNQLNNIVINVKCSFLIIIIKYFMIARRKKNDILDVDFVHNFICEVIDKSQPYLIDLDKIIKRSQGSVFAYELAIIEYIKSFFKYIDRSSDSNNELIERFYNRVFFDVCHGVCKKDASECLIFISAKYRDEFKKQAAKYDHYKRIVNNHFENFLNYENVPECYQSISILVINDTEYRSIYLKKIIDSRIDNDPVKLIYVLRSLFCGIETNDLWAELYDYFFVNFREFCDMLISQFPKEILKLYHFIVEKIPNSNPFHKKYISLRFKMVKCLFSTLNKISIELLSDLYPLQVDENVFNADITPGDTEAEENISLSESRSLGLARSKDMFKTFRLKKSSSLDNEWEYLSYILLTANIFLGSPIPNFGIMRQYKDFTPFELLNTLLQALNLTNFSDYPALHSINELVKHFLFFLWFINDIVSFLYDDENLFTFVINLTRAGFLTSNIDVIQLNCLLIKKIILSAKNFNVSKKFIPHFYYAFNILLKSYKKAIASMMFTVIKAQENPVGFALEVNEKFRTDLCINDENKTFIYHLDQVCNRISEMDLSDEDGDKVWDFIREKREMNTFFNIKINYLPSFKDFF